jgi:outer membrane receptor protein involved in Fe transport
VQDPCADFSQLDESAIERCIAQGVPADGSFTQTGQETPVLGGGNPDLGPERADTFTLGFTYQPGWLDGLIVSLDYYDIEITNGISALGANTILEQCLATGEAAFCNRIERDAEGNIVHVSGQLQNIATETASGLDLEVHFAQSGWGGAFAHRALVSYVADRDLVAFPGAEPFAGAGGYDSDTFGAIPRWRATYNIDWTGQRWQLGYGAQWIGPVDETGGELYPGTVNEVSGQLYHDLFARFIANPAVTVSGGVDNLTDETPPFFANADEANTDVATYRLLGRTYWLRFGFRLL